jgi:hypothetical protein
MSKCFGDVSPEAIRSVHTCHNVHVHIDCYDSKSAQYDLMLAASLHTIRTVPYPYRNIPLTNSATEYTIALMRLHCRVTLAHY